MKTTIRILLALAACFLAYLCVDSVMTPIRFEEARVDRQTAVVAKLIDIRTAEVEYRTQKGVYTADFDTLFTFLRTAKKKEVMKEGSLTEAQLESGMTEAKAVKIINKAKEKAAKILKTDNDSTLYAYVCANDKDVKQNGLVGFRRDTIFTNLIGSLYNGKYDEQTIEQIRTIPYTDGTDFELEVNNDYTTVKGNIRVPLLEARAPFTTFLGDLDHQQLVNLIDTEKKMDHYPGLKIGSIDEPNNNAGNWE